MELKLFKTLWGFDGDYLKAVEEAVADGYDGMRQSMRLCAMNLPLH